jgi:hypothetical protein
VPAGFTISFWKKNANANGGTEGRWSHLNIRLRPINDVTGLRQDYKMRDGYQFRLGTTIVVTTDKDRLVLDASYPERWKKELEPVFERVVGSLQFSESGATQTYPVSEQLTESR